MTDNLCLIQEPDVMEFLFFKQILSSWHLAFLGGSEHAIEKLNTKLLQKTEPYTPYTSLTETKKCYETDFEFLSLN